MDYLAITLLITFLLLSIWKLSETIQYDTHLRIMQDYLDECERQNQKDEKEDYVNYLKEMEQYDKLMKEKTDR